MQPVLDIVIPVFGIIAAGYFCGYRGLLGDDASSALNQFVYWVALPALLFKAMASVSLSDLMNVPFIASFLGAIIVLWAMAILTARILFGLTLAQASLHGMNGIYGNSGYMGIPLAVTAFGTAATLPAIIVTVVNTAFVVGVAIVLIEYDRSEKARAGKLAAKVTGALVRNPMLMAPFAGIAYAATGWPLPEAAKSFTGLLGAAAGPCALFSIGLFMVGKKLSEGRAETLAMTVTKLVLQPSLTAFLLFYVWPADPTWTKVAILMAALPTGTGSFVLAQAYGIYVLRTSSATLATTVLSVVTNAVFFVVFPPVG
ncbi:MAG: AEC family transporter [Hyphomicrobiales bacterium]|nr:AEC family transporter [Hyphomicrobiales bacterium]